MNEQHLADVISSATEIPCMLLPVVGYTLLLPNTSVAEMSVVQPLQPVDNAPEWLLGMYAWRGICVPVISIEAINGGTKPPLNPKGRIAVLNNTGVSDQVKFIAIHTQGIPRMSRVAESDIEEQPEIERRPYDLMAVKVGVEEFYIPDISAIEKTYAETSVE